MAPVSVQTQKTNLIRAIFVAGLMAGTVLSGNSVRAETVFRDFLSGGDDNRVNNYRHARDHHIGPLGVKRERRSPDGYQRVIVIGPGDYREVREVPRSAYFEDDPRPAPEFRAPSIEKIAAPEYYTYEPEDISDHSVTELLGGIARNSENFSELSNSETLKVEDDIASAMQAFYQKHGRFLWVAENGINPEAMDVLALLTKAHAHGLSNDHYAVEVPNGVDRVELIRFEAELSARVIRYARDMKDGVVDPNRLSGYHDFSERRLSAESALEALSKPGNALAYLNRLEPRAPAYEALKQELALLLEAENAQSAITITEDVFVRPGESHQEMANILRALEKKLEPVSRIEHASALTISAGDLTLNSERVEAVKAFQRQAGLKVDGVVGPNTVRALSDLSRDAKIEKIKLSLERLRWHPEDFGHRHVFINQPAYRAAYIENDNEVLAMKVIVGQKSNQTSFFYDEIESVVYNPYWGVPQSIIVNEMLPKLHRDPGYLDRNGYIVTNSSGRQIASANIDWWQFAGEVPYDVRQRPGPENALGELKILFPNKHAIYMHDTPARDLFSRSERALSHGCIRLERPREMAAAVLGKDKSYVSAKVSEGHSEEEVGMKIPVYSAYFTAWPSESGSVEYYPDIYDRDVHLIKALEATRRDG